MNRIKYLVAAIFFLPATMMMAQTFDDLPIPIEDVNKVVDNTPDSIAKALMSRPAPGTTRVGTNPVLFLIGNSTMRNGTRGDGSNGQWGWGFFANKYFDGRKISVENQALGGMSTRTFYTKLWPAVREALQPGDWVIVSIGHNDGGPLDEGRARAVLSGTGQDSVNVTIKEIDEKTGKIIRKPQSGWLAEVSKELDVPYVDLNELSGAKLDSYSPWKEKYHFFGDHIHTSAYGAEMNARSAAEGLAACTHPALRPLQAMMLNVELPTYGIRRETGKPIVFITGDSTVKNSDKDDDGMWGWGALAGEVFDETKITLANVAMAGRSTRSYLREGRWEKVYNQLQPGDFVLIEFGHNDICSITDSKERGVIPGTKDTCHVYKMEKDGRFEVVYSFGWYLKKMIDDTREKGATPILVSLTPRNEWPTGKIERRNDSYGKWYREVVEETKVEFLDLHNLSADVLDNKFAVKKLPKNKEKVKAKVEKIKAKAGVYFKKDHTHASKAGALLNAESVARGLRQNGSKLAEYLKND